MPTLDELRQSVSELSDEELGKLILNIRAERRVRPAKVQKAPAAKAKTATSGMSAEQMLSALSPQQIAELLAKLAR